MQIVIEYVLLESFVINLIVHKTTEMILHEKAKFVFLFAFLSSCVTVAIPAIGLSTFGNFLLVFGLNMVIVSLSFNFVGSVKQKLVSFSKTFCTFYLSAFLYGGACYFAVGLFGESVLIVAFVAICLTFLLVRVIAKLSKRRQIVEKFCYDVMLSLNDKRLNVRGFLDTGNLLFDPVTGRNLILINVKTFEKLCGNVTFEDVLLRSEKLKELELSHFVKIQGVGANEKIFVFQADEIRIGDVIEKNPILGLTFRDFRNLCSDVILNSSLVKV